ncbi:MAG: Pr6Pr family membrane protein [Mycoplasmataceae bacterium]|nr:Pr6Pr family membrane protein [Mycoplasmataceae bacterium]
MKTKKLNQKEIVLGLIGLIYAFVLLLVLINAAVASKEWHFYLFFTNESNFYCCIWFLLYGIVAFSPKLVKLRQFVTHAVTMTSVLVYMTVTFLIVAFWLYPIYKGEWIPSLFDDPSTLFTHLLTFVLMVLFYFLVKGTGKVNFVHVIYVLIYPIAYLITVEIVGSCTEWYPYDFLTPSLYGTDAKGIAIFGAVILALVAIFYGIGFGLSKLKHTIDQHHLSTI